MSVQVLVWWREAKRHTVGRRDGDKIRTRNPDDEPCMLMPDDGRVVIESMSRRSAVQAEHRTRLEWLEGWLNITEASWRGGFYVDMTPEMIVNEWCAELADILSDQEDR